jgi:hypothetical protein
VSRRKWPFYVMPVGAVEVVSDSRLWLAKKISAYARDTGKRFRTRKVGEVRRIERVA